MRQAEGAGQGVGYTAADLTSLAKLLSGELLQLKEDIGRGL